MRRLVCILYFSGFSRLTQYNISALGLDIAQLIEQETRQDLILEVKSAYFEVLQKEKLEEVARQAVTQLQAQSKVSENFYEVGMVPKNDFLQAQVAGGTAVPSVPARQ